MPSPEHSATPLVVVAARRAASVENITQKMGSLPVGSTPTGGAGHPSKLDLCLLPVLDGEEHDDPQAFSAGHSSHLEHFVGLVAAAVASARGDPEGVAVPDVVELDRPAPLGGDSR